MSRYIDVEQVRFEKGEMNNYTEYGIGFNDGIKFCKAEIERVPTSDVVEVQHGEWECKESVHMNWFFRYAPKLKVIERRCSKCGLFSYDLYEYGGYKEMQYCCRCGAKIDGEREQND